MENLVSVIVPVYNTGAILEDTVQSILNSTYQKIEIVIIDDGSNETTANLCDYLAEKDRRVVVYHEENHGVSVARNTGIKYANGELVMFVDSDDLISENAIFTLVEELVFSGADVSMGAYREWYGENRYKVYSRNNKKIEYSGEEILKEFLLYNTFDWNVWNKIYKKEILGDVRFPEKVRIAEDMYFLYQVCKKIHKIVYVNDVLYDYRKQGESAMNDRNVRKFVDSYEMIKRVYSDLIDSEDSKRVDWVTIFYVKNALRYLRLLACKDKHKAAIKEFEVARKEILSIVDDSVFRNLSVKNKIEYFLLKYSRSLFKLCGKATIK